MDVVYSYMSALCKRCCWWKWYSGHDSEFMEGCQYHIPQYTQADALGLYIKCPLMDLRQLNAAIIKKIQDVNVFINTTALGASVVAK